MKRRHPCTLLVCLALAAVGTAAGCDEPASSVKNVEEAPTAKAPEKKAEPAVSPLAATAAAPATAAVAAAEPAGAAEALAPVLARYQTLTTTSDGTEPHVFGLTMHKMTVKPSPGTPFMVRIGEEGGLVGAHEIRALFGDAASGARVKDALPKLVAAALGPNGHEDNAVALIRQAMAKIDAEGCKAARLGSLQVIAQYKPVGMGSQHEVSVLIGDSRARGGGSLKLFGMLGARARTCGSVRAAP